VILGEKMATNTKSHHGVRPEVELSLSHQQAENRMSDGSRKWISGTFDGHDYPLCGKDWRGRNVTVMGPAYPDNAFGVDPNQLYVIAANGEAFLTFASLIVIPASDGSDAWYPLRAKAHGPPRPSPFLGALLAEQERLKKAGYFEAVDRFNEMKDRLAAKAHERVAQVKEDARLEGKGSLDLIWDMDQVRERLRLRAQARGAQTAEDDRLDRQAFRDAKRKLDELNKRLFPKPIA
jgi:hypothetical protein